MPDQLIDLGFRPRPWQDEALRSLRRFSVVVVHRRGGKTVMAVMKQIDSALRAVTLRPRFGYIAPELKQAKTVAWDYLRSYSTKIPGVRVNESELWVEYPHNEARIRIYGADAPDSLRGLYFDGVVLDEVAQMRPNVWGEIIVPTLADRSGDALFIGTPKGVNLFSKLYFDARGKEDWYSRTFTIEDTHALSEEELETMRREMSDQQWRQEMLCDFSASSDDVLIPLALVDAALGKHYSRDKYMMAAKVVGVDVARQGGDRTVIQGRQGLVAYTPIVMKGADSVAVAVRVAEYAELFDPDAIFIDGSGGYGAGVIDHLRQVNLKPLEIQFGGEPFDVRFANKRAEMWVGIRDWLRAGGALPNMNEYRIDLTGTRYDYANARGRLQLESKEKLTGRGLPSPDFGDALALTFAAPVAPRARLDNPFFGIDLAGSVTHSKTDYDVLDYNR
jgi:hypothetical protein